jgi:hypothetical protein
MIFPASLTLHKTPGTFISQKIPPSNETEILVNDFFSLPEVTITPTKISKVPLSNEMKMFVNNLFSSPELTLSSWNPKISKIPLSNEKKIHGNVESVSQSHPQKCQALHCWSCSKVPSGRSRSRSRPKSPASACAAAAGGRSAGRTGTAHSCSPASHNQLLISPIK